MVLVMMLTMAPSYAFAEGNDEGIESFQADTAQETLESGEAETAEETDSETTAETIEEENTKKETAETTREESRKEESETVEDTEVEPEPEVEDTETTVKTDENVKKESANTFDSGKNKTFNLQSIKRVQAQSAQTFSTTPEVHADENTGIVNSLNDAVSNVTITGATQNEDGSYTVYKGSNYGLKLTFTESEGKQIPFDDRINYTLPEGFAIINLGETITIQATITHEGSTTTQDVRFLVSYNGNVITMTPAENQDEVLDALGRANDAHFSLNINASWNGDNGNHEIDFGNDVNVTIDVPSDADLQYRKSAVYNKEAGTVDYTITVSSEGNSTGVVITDTITGDAVTINTDTINVTSSTGNASKVTFSQSSGAGFTTNPFDMSNGETITITYSATVDYSNLEGNEITFDDVKNIVEAKSEQKPDPDPVDTTFTDTKAFDYAVKGMGEGGSFTLTEANKDETGDYYILPWRIDVNPDFHATGNITFTDTLQNSELQKYDPESFEIKAYNENGKEVNIPSGTYTLPLEDAPQWNQTLPAQIGGVTVRYEITYNTRVKVSDIPPYTGTSVGNGITVGGDVSSPGSVTVPPQLEYEVNKDVRSYDIEGKTANWQVTVDVPAEGFSQSFKVTDTLPSLWYGNPNTLYKHTLDQASLEVKLGDTTLTSDEDYTFEYTDNPYGADGFALTFHMNEGTPGGGIPPAGHKQKITISYTTSYKSWISGQAVVNSVNVEADGRPEGDNAEYTPVDKEIVKEANSHYSGSDINHTVTYTVGVIGVTQDDLNEDGYITVEDEFNPDYLRYVDRTWGGGKTVYGTQSPGNYGETPAGEYEVTDSSDGNLTFRFKPELRTSDEGKQEYYARYYFRYELAIKDEAALQKLIELAAGGTAEESYATSLTTDFLKNTATWGSSSDELTVQFDSNPLKKENIEQVSGSNGYTATWKITINETGAKLNNGSDMEITDDFTAGEDEYEMTYVQDSMVVKYDGKVQASPEFTYDDSGILKWIIPDSTKVEIEYKTQITGNVTGKKKIRNDAEITGKGVGDSVEQNFDISSGGAGTASATGFSIYKVDVNDETLPLKGAVFQLWCTNGDGEKIPFEYIDPDTKEQVSQPITFTTDEDGIVHVNSDQDRNGWSLYKHRVYILEEVEAPEGYEDVSEDPIEITIWIDNYGGNVNENLDEVPCPENAVVVQPNTTIRVVNGQITVPVSKTLTGRDWTDDEFQIQITPQGNAPAVTSDIITLTKESQEGEFILSGFRQPGTYKYTIAEIAGTDEDINYSKAEYEVTVNVTQVQDEDGTNYYDVTSDISLVKDYAGNTTDVSVNEAQFVNSVGQTTNVSVSKKWEGIEGQLQSKPESVQIQLMAGDVAQGAPITLNAENEWKYTWTNLAEKDENGSMINYSVHEVGESKGTVEFDGTEYKVTYTGDAETGYTITNSYTPETTEVSVSKRWEDNNNQDGKRPESIQVQLYANGKAQGEPVVLNAGNKWSHTWSELDEKAEGKAIEYTVKEAGETDGKIDFDGTEYKVTYTGDAETGYTITNSYTPETTEVSVSKRWEDNNNQDGKRPESIQVQLYANGKAQGEPVVLNAGNKWSHTWSELDEKAEGTAIEYTVKEVGETDGKIDFNGTEYQVTYTGNATGGYVITNSYTPEKISIPVTKNWQDNDDQDGIRPNEITVKLLADGKDTGKILTLNAEGSWKGTFADLAKYKAGQEIQYTLEEVSVKGYASSITGDMTKGFVITNSHTPETTEVSGSKTWNDANDQDGKRPESITIRLLANGTEVDEKEVSADDNWSWSFTDLPKDENGTEITYTITEDAVPNYETHIKGHNVTNTYAPGKTSVSVVKSWNDADDQDGRRPGSIQVQLYADGKAQGKPVVLNAQNQWSHIWSGLDEKSEGKEIEYTVKEIGETDGKIDFNGAEYQVTYTGNAAAGYTITNSYTPETTEVSGSKTWNDANDQDGKRPESITIRLLANGTEVDAKEVSADENWSFSFTDLPKYENGTEIDYTITEDTVDGYSTAYSGYDVINSYIPGKTSITVTKNWEDSNNQDGIRPNEITVKLLADGEDTGKILTLNEANNWKGSFTELSEYENGEVIEYTVEEVSVEGYKTVVTGSMAEGYIITNSHTPETTEVSGSKTWNDANDQDGKRPESITIRLLANGTEVDTKEVGADENWSWSFTDLPKYEAGKEIIYTITEDAVPDYTTEVKGYDVTNTYAPGKTSVSVVKSWNDAEDQDGKRPESIQVQLYADGEAYGEPAVLNVENSWSHTWSDLNEKSEGNAIEYTVEEVGETDGKIEFNGAEYLVTYTGDAAAGYTITNSYTAERITVSGSKTWDDKGNENARPESITIRLYADNEEIAETEVTADDDWSWDFENLPKYRDGGQEIVYTISEDIVKGYVTEVNGFDVKNTYTPGKTSVSVAKRWDDSDNRDGKRPDGVLVQLYADGEALGDPVVLNKSNDWRYTWSELDEQADGKEIVYTVKEVGEEKGTIDFGGTKYKVTYTGNADRGYTITNSYNAVSAGVQTGDNTDMASNLAVMFAAIAVAGTAVIFRRRRYNEK